MSRQNKVNPGMYTQRGRLSQDDAARELRKTTKSASLTANAKAGKATTAGTRETKRTTRKAKVGKAMTPILRGSR